MSAVTRKAEITQNVSGPTTGRSGLMIRLSV